MRFASEKPSPSPNSDEAVLLEVQAGTGQKMVVARVKGSSGHLLKRLLSDPSQSQHNAQCELSSYQTQISPALESQAGSVVSHLNLNTSLINAPSKSQRPCI
jgi:hypothetical protein